MVGVIYLELAIADSLPNQFAVFWHLPTFMSLRT